MAKHFNNESGFRSHFASPSGSCFPPGFSSSSFHLHLFIFALTSVASVIEIKTLGALIYQLPVYCLLQGLEKMIPGNQALYAGFEG